MTSLPRFASQQSARRKQDVGKNLVIDVFRYVHQQHITELDPHCFRSAFAKSCAADLLQIRCLTRLNSFRLDAGVRRVDCRLRRYRCRHPILNTRPLSLPGKCPAAQPISHTVSLGIDRSNRRNRGRNPVRIHRQRQVVLRHHIILRCQSLMADGRCRVPREYEHLII